MVFTDFGGLGWCVCFLRVRTFSGLVLFSRFICYFGLCDCGLGFGFVWVVWLWFGFWVGVDNGGFGGLLICFLGGWRVWYFLVYGWS